MKYGAFIVFVIFILFFTNSFASNFTSGETITIDSSITHDIYVACKNFTVNGSVKGDITGAAQNITINNTIDGDLSLAGEMVNINGEVKDDIRNFARNFKLNANIDGDLILFSGESYIAKQVIIAGDLVVFSGEVVVDGNVRGNVIIKGGKITVNGMVEGNVKIEGGEILLNGSINGMSVVAANSIIIGSNAHFNGDVRYWRKEGELNLTPSQYDGKFIYDPTLRRSSEKKNGAALGIGFIIWNILSGILLLIALLFLFEELFYRAGAEIRKEPVKSFGYGVLYLVLVPVICLLLLFTFIGIPLSLTLFFFYLFTIFSGLIISSLVLANFYNEKYQKHLTKWKIFGVSILILVLLHIVLFIPVLGFVACSLTVASCFGALVTSLKRRKPEIGSASL